MVVFMVQMVIYYGAKYKITLNKSKSKEEFYILPFFRRIHLYLHLSDQQKTFTNSGQGTNITGSFGTQYLNHKQVLLTFQIQHLAPEIRSTSCTSHHFFLGGYG